MPPSDNLHPQKNETFANGHIRAFLIEDFFDQNLRYKTPFELSLATDGEKHPNLYATVWITHCYYYIKKNGVK